MTFAVCAITVVGIATGVLVYSLLRDEADNPKPQHLEDQPGWRDALNQTGNDVDENVFASSNKSASDTAMSRGADHEMTDTQNTGRTSDE